MPNDDQFAKDLKNASQKVLSSFDDYSHHILKLSGRSYPGREFEQPPEKQVFTDALSDFKSKLIKAYADTDKTRTGDINEIVAGTAKGLRDMSRPLLSDAQKEIRGLTYITGGRGQHTINADKIGAVANYRSTEAGRLEEDAKNLSVLRAKVENSPRSEPKSKGASEVSEGHLSNLPSPNVGKASSKAPTRQ